MCTIHVQGVCFFRRCEDHVDVYLPVSDGDTHVDGTDANKHYPRLFVELVPGVTATGDFSIRDHAETIKGRHHYIKGVSIDLSRGEAGERQVFVTNQKRKVDAGALDDILSFAKFTGGTRYPIDEARIAAWLRASGGKFRVAKTVPKQGKWKVKKTLLNQTGDAEFDELAWDVIWEPGKKKKKDHEIIVSEGADVVATVTVPSRAAPRIILGNLDNENSATWPLRPLKPMTRCEGIDGSHPSGDGYCYDNDFKWLYGLLKGSYPGSGYAPVARAEIPAPTGPSWSIPIAYDTPTCFPGGD